jgi:uncharacterized protein GlcG (DUF336 family)
MRANSIGPLRSAALVISSAAVRTTGNARSDEGMVLTRCAIASRNDASLTPLGSSMGSAKGLSQDTTQLHNKAGISSGHGPTRFSVGRRISFPIKVDGEIVGAIGVSGAPTVQNDVDCARAALALVSDVVPAE